MHCRLEHIPPGEYAVRVDAALVPNDPEDDSELYDIYTFAYCHFSMESTTKTITITPTYTDLRLEVPIDIINFNSDIEIFMSLERIGPTCTFGSPEMLSLLYRNFYVDPYPAKDLIAPFVGTMGCFTFDNITEHKALCYIPLVPPGKYKLKLYNDLHTMASDRNSFYHEEYIDIPAGSGTITRQVPYVPYKEPDFSPVAILKDPSD
jgi:hypothetical protein